MGNRNKKTGVRMHRIILERAQGPPSNPGMSCDHKNRRKYDNRRCNLRWVTHKFNMNNMTRRKENKSGRMGVNHDIASCRFYVNGPKNVQYFKYINYDFRDAQRAWNEAVECRCAFETSSTKVSSTASDYNKRPILNKTWWEECCEKVRHYKEEYNKGQRLKRLSNLDEARAKARAYHHRIKDRRNAKCRENYWKKKVESLTQEKRQKDTRKRKCSPVQLGDSKSKKVTK